jgi:DNA invertase Pin-like site-specific DNA recombinase
VVGSAWIRLRASDLQMTRVDLMGAYSNRQDLADSLVSTMQQLRQAQAQGGESVPSMRSTRSHRQWRVGDRLGEAEIEELIGAFTAGMSKRKLAERYGISESSVKRLIRQHGASKQSSGLSRHQWEHLLRGNRRSRW